MSAEPLFGTNTFENVSAESSFGTDTFLQSLSTRKVPYKSTEPLLGTNTRPLTLGEINFSRQHGRAEAALCILKSGVQYKY